MNAVFISVPPVRGVLRDVAALLTEVGYEVQHNPKTPFGGPRLVVSAEDDHVFIFNQSDPDEVAEIMSEPLRQKRVAVLVIEYYLLPLVKRIIEALADDAETTVDNDHGVSLRGDEFVRRLRADASWDWRVVTRRE